MNIQSQLDLTTLLGVTQTVVKSRDVVRLRFFYIDWLELGIKKVSLEREMSSDRESLERAVTVL